MRFPESLEFRIVMKCQNVIPSHFLDLFIGLRHYDIYNSGDELERTDEGVDVQGSAHETEFDSVGILQVDGLIATGVLGIFLGLLKRFHLVLDTAGNAVYITTDTGCPATAIRRAAAGTLDDIIPELIPDIEQLLNAVLGIIQDGEGRYVDVQTAGTAAVRLIAMIPQILHCLCELTLVVHVILHGRGMRYELDTIPTEASVMLGVGETEDVIDPIGDGCGTFCAIGVPLGFEFDSVVETYVVLCRECDAVGLIGIVADSVRMQPRSIRSVEHVAETMIHILVAFMADPVIAIAVIRGAIGNRDPLAASGAMEEVIGCAIGAVLLAVGEGVISASIMDESSAISAWGKVTEAARAEIIVMPAPVIADIRVPLIRFLAESSTEGAAIQIRLTGRTCFLTGIFSYASARGFMVFSAEITDDVVDIAAALADVDSVNGKSIGSDVPAMAVITERILPVGAGSTVASAVTHDAIIVQMAFTAFGTYVCVIFRKGGSVVIDTVKILCGDQIFDAIYITVFCSSVLFGKSFEARATEIKSALHLAAFIMDLTALRTHKRVIFRTVRTDVTVVNRLSSIACASTVIAVMRNDAEGIDVYRDHLIQRDHILGLDTVVTLIRSKDGSAGHFRDHFCMSGRCRPKSSGFRIYGIQRFLSGRNSYIEQVAVDSIADDYPPVIRSVGKMRSTGSVKDRFIYSDNSSGNDSTGDSICKSKVHFYILLIFCIMICIVGCLAL